MRRSRRSTAAVTRPAMAVAVAALTLAACGGSSGAPSASALQHRWVLTSFSTGGPDRQASAEQPAEMDLSAGGKVTGTTGCNSFGGSWSLTGDTLRLGEVGMTTRACLDETITAQEDAIARVLSATKTATVDGDRLTIRATDGTTTLVFVRADAAPATTTTTVPTPPRLPLDIAWSDTGPSGSGCTPGGPVLPDGTWLGILKIVDAPGGTISIDLICYYTNAAARAAGIEPPDFPLNDSIVNQSAQLFVVPTWSNVQVIPLDVDTYGPTGMLAPTRTGVAAANDVFATGNGDVVWVRIVGGRAIVIQQMFRM